MTKLIIVFTFTALVAFAFAHRPIVTTTTILIEEGSSVYSKQQCSQQLKGQKFNQCQTYITSSIKQNCCLGHFGCHPCVSNREGDQQVQGQGLQGLEECCNELKRVEEECQCEAMQKVYRKVQKQQWSQQQQPQTQDLQQTVQNLRNQCSLQVKQCQIPSAAMF